MPPGKPTQLADHFKGIGIQGAAPTTGVEAAPGAGKTKAMREAMAAAQNQMPQEREPLGLISVIKDKEPHKIPWNVDSGVELLLCMPWKPNPIGDLQPSLPVILTHPALRPDAAIEEIYKGQRYLLLSAASWDASKQKAAEIVINLEIPVPGITQEMANIVQWLEEQK